MNAARLPSTFHLLREYELTREAANRYAADNYTAGVAEGWRQARKESDAAAIVYLIFGTCFGVVLTIVAAGVVL